MSRQSQAGVAPGPPTDRPGSPHEAQPAIELDEDAAYAPEQAPRAYASPTVELSRANESTPGGAVWSGLCGVQARASTCAPVGPGAAVRCQAASPADLPRVGAVRQVPQRPRRAAHVSAYPIDQEALLYDAALQTVYHLNSTAYGVWCLCDGRTPTDIARAMTGAFDVSFETALAHTREVVEVLTIGELLFEDHEDGPRS